MTYVYQPVNPLQSFAQGFQAVQGLRDMRAEQVAKQQQAMRQQDLQVAIQNLRMNPSPQAIADFGLQFPEMKEQMDGYFKTLSEAAKNAEVNAARDALIAERTGGDIAAVYDRYAEAAENSRDPVAAKKFRDAAEFARQNPQGAAEVTKLHLAFADGEAYKRVFDNSLYDTATIKELIAEGLEYGTPEFQDALRQKREGDPWVGVPGVGLFLRKDLEAAAAGGASDVTPSIPEGAVKMLIQNPKLREDFDKKYGKGAADRVLGGAGGNASGNFRGGGR